MRDFFFCYREFSQLSALQGACLDVTADYLFSFSDTELKRALWESHHDT